MSSRDTEIDFWEDAQHISDIGFPEINCQDMHLNGEVNGPCGDNVDLCGIISRDIASSKLLSDVGNDSVGGDSNQSVLSNSVGVEENGNVDSSDSDGEDMDVPSDDSSSRIQEGECAELATEDGMVDDDGSRDGAMMDSEMADAGDASLSSPAMEDLEKESSAGMSGIVGVDSSQETDLAVVGDDSRETDTAEREDDEDDDSEDTGMAEREDAEEIGMVRRGDDLQETDIESRGGDNFLGTSIEGRDEDIQETGIEERRDLHETGVEGTGDDLEDDGAEGSGDSFQDGGIEGRGDSLQEASIEDKDYNLQEDGVEGRGDSLQESGVEVRDDSLQESDVEVRDDSLQESDVEVRDDSLQESGVEARDDSLQESGVVESDHLQETDNVKGDESLETDLAGKVVSQEAFDKPKDSVEDESMEVDHNSAISKPACDSTTKESDEMCKTSLKLTKSDCESTDATVADSSVSKMNSIAVAGENPVAKKLEDSSASSSKTDVKSDDMPGKIKKSRKSFTPLNVTPRRSSRNLSKSQKTYSEHEEDPDIEEITPQDPLADPLSGEVARDKEPIKPRVSRNKTTIVVNDTKRLVEIAAGSKPSKGGKKEPTLVIIDTNSILSGRGPVPVSQSIQPPSSSPASGYSMLPVALPAQGLYPSNITQSASPTVMSTPLRTSTPVAAVPQPRQPPQILPSLTDDMYVVEAPSFIVPYVYEKPPIKPLKEYVECLGKELEKLKEEQKALEASNKEAEQDEAEKGDVSKESDGDKFVEGKEEGERQGQNDKSHLDAPDETTNLPRHAKVTNGEDGDDETHRENSENTKQARKAETAELKNELKSSDVNGDVSESKGGSKLEDKEKGDSSKGESSKPTTYFDNPLGKFFMQIGVNLVQEYVQTDLLRSQKKKRDREGGKGASVTQFAISSLLKNLELSKENNEPFHLRLKKCEFCNFKTESSLVMAQHLETPHMKNYVYRCNFCTLEVRSPHDILFHMEAEHNVRGRLERAPAFHQCPNCPFEDNQKGKLSRHLISCLKKFKPEKNQEPPLDWEPPAKIPRVSRNRPSSMGIAYQALSAKQVPQHPLLPKLVPSPQVPVGVSSSGRGRGRPPLHSRYLGEMGKIPVQRPIAPTQIRQSMLYRSTASGSPMLVPTTYQISGNQIYQVVGGQGQMMPVMSSGITPVPRIALMSPTSAPSQSVSSATPTPVALVPSNAITIQNAHKNNPTAKLLQQPSISITPLPRQPAALTPPSAGLKQAATSSGGKATFVICEICDGYIKDLEQLRNHMQWIHKVKIHPKMIYNRPPLNCQKCQFRFFTDQGLERHLLGSHGLVTSSMQEAANKGKDGGRCPVCGRVYQWKLLNHVARDHNMTLKPAHLSYKCTVCTATFGMYKQFENHVYSAHSVVAKRVMDKKTTSPGQQPSRAQGAPGDSLLKPLKINDEITIIPQPARPRPGPASRTGAISAAAQAASNAKVWQCDDCEATFDGPTGFAQFTAHVKRRHLRRCSVRLCRLDACPTCKQRYVTGAVLEWLRDRSGVDVIELSDDEVVIGQGRSEITITKVSCAPGPKRFKQRLQQAKVQVIEIEDSPIKAVASEESGEDSLTAVKERLRRRKSLEISQIDADGLPQATEDLPSKKRRKIGDD